MHAGNVKWGEKRNNEGERSGAMKEIEKIQRGKKCIKSAWDYILDLVFPRRCPVCDKIIGINGALVCPSCREKLQMTREPLCRKCGKELMDEAEEYCLDCRKRTHYFDEGAALYEYFSVRDSIYRFKYMGRQEYKDFYGEEMARHLGHKMREWKADALVPIPIHPARRQKRGYNQAELLAEEIGKRIGIPVLSDYIVRIKKTAPQKELNAGDRQNNLKKAFKIGRNDVKLDTIIIVDDIYTTGSTIDEAAKLCRRMGVEKVYFVVLAMGQGL